MSELKPPRRDPRAMRDQQRASATTGTSDAVPVDATPTRRPDPRLAQQERRRDVQPPPSAEAASAAMRVDPRAKSRQRAAGLPSPVPVVAAVSEVVRVDDCAPWCLAVPDLRDGTLSTHDREVLAAARALADACGGGVVAIAPAAAADYALLGVDRLVDLNSDGGFAPQGQLAAVMTVIDRFRPRHIVLPDTATAGGHLGRMLAVRLCEPVVCGVVRLSPTEAIRRADGGRTDQTIVPPRIVLLAPEAIMPRFAGRREARTAKIEIAPPVEPVADGGKLPLDVRDLSLADADFIVSGGSGVNDWSSFRAVAGALGATIGATRAVCDAGHMPRSRQVGASGTLVDPRCYLSFGISGAPQHLQGITRCERVVAVNTDLHAEMIKRADLAIVADAQAVMASLLDLVGRSK